MKSSGLRFHEIDFLRGVACISVVAFHFLSRRPQIYTMPGVDFPLVEAVARYGYLGVQLFFVISGFVILMSAQDATVRSFAASRVSRLYPALWVAATITAGCAWILGDARFAVSSGDYLVNLTMLPQWFNVPYVDSAYWSLAYELHFYIMVGVAIRLRLMARLEWLLAGWLLISAVNALRPMWPLEFWLNAQWAPFFTAGGLCYLIRTQGITLFRLILLGVSFALAQIYTVQYGPLHSVSAAQSLVPFAVAVSIVTVIFGLFWLIATGRFRMNASPSVFYLGALTYPLYVVHQNLGYMMYERLLKATGLVTVSLALMLALLLLISWCIFTFIERPFGPILRSWLSKPASENARPSEPPSPPASQVTSARTGTVSNVPPAR